MEVNFTYTKKEWIRSHRAYQFLMKRITKLQVVVTLLLPIMLAIQAYEFGASGLVIGFAVITCLTYAITIFVMFIQPRYIYNKTEKYHLAYKMVFTEEGIRFETKNISSDIGWDVYTGYAETDEFFYLLQGKINYSLLPKRAFQTKQQQEQFQMLLKQKYD